jgi:thiomorpholine-carboxylate dehydrogenase
MQTFDEARVRALLSFDTLIPAMERALTDLSAGRVQQPLRSIIPVPAHGGLFGLMPAVYGDVLGAKLVMVYPGNADRGLPTHLATVQLFRAMTGELLATMDGRLITEMRTAAVSAVATKLLARPDAHVLAILGSGVQARSHIQALRLVRAFDEIRIWSPTAAHAKQCAEEVGGVAMPAEDAVRGADVVVTVTGSGEPVLRGAWLSDGTHVNAVGAVGPARRELDEEAMRGAVIVESREAALAESGDILIAQAPIYAELGELLAGSKPMPRARTTIFKSLGQAVEDIAAARLVYDAASGEMGERLEQKGQPKTGAKH